MTESPNRSNSAIEIPVATIEAQVIKAVVSSILEQLEPQIGKVDSHVRSTRSAGYGIILMIGIALGAGYFSYDASMTRQETRDKAQDDRHADIQETLDATVTELTKALSEHTAIDREARAAANRSARAINDLYERIMRNKARPVAVPFPDVVTHATGP